MVKTVNEKSGVGAVNECGVCGPFPVKPSVKSVQQQANLFEETKQLQANTFWIRCDLCNRWYHGECVNVEEYESALIDEFHCDCCTVTNGPSTMKRVLLDHRYSFEDATQINQPTQIGTKRFIEEFKKKSESIPLATEEHVITVEDGYKFAEAFNRKDVWKQIYLISSVDGLGLQLPKKGFSLKNCVDIVGVNRMVDTIDVYKQHTYQMSFGRFYELFTAKERPRLYNILSLEFSHSKLSKIIQPPKLVAELSWVRRFWSQHMGHTPIAHMITSKSILNQHLKAKPEVELFCLVGMKDSYTDFHIDFGGSSVWYHVFEGQKVFYVIAPTEENLIRFTDYENSWSRTELFFGDVVPKGSIFKVVINAGETLMIPAGWIHAVWTPCDSLVFGGNFLHSLNIEMQLRVYEMEMFLATDDRFMFPSFELVNWYAAACLLKLFTEANTRKEVVQSCLVSGAKALVASLNRWIARDEVASGDLSGSRWCKVFRKLKRKVELYEMTYNSSSKSKTGAENDESAKSKQFASSSSGEMTNEREEMDQGEEDAIRRPFSKEVDDALSGFKLEDKVYDCVVEVSPVKIPEELAFVYEDGTNIDVDGSGSMKKRKMDEQSGGDGRFVQAGASDDTMDATTNGNAIELTNSLPEEEMQESQMSMFSHHRAQERTPDACASVATMAVKPIVFDPLFSLEIIGTPTAKKIPPPHEGVASVSGQVKKAVNDPVAEVVIEQSHTSGTLTAKNVAPSHEDVASVSYHLEKAVNDLVAEVVIERSQTVDTRTAKKIPCRRGEMASVSDPVEKTVSDVVAKAVIKQSHFLISSVTGKSSANSKKKKASTARERIARKLNIKL
uniref:JmjC domain-containing protein n=1 Tax=Parascaris univalens TaxID=6257 RepID=A0A915A5A9_PARUN